VEVVASLSQGRTAATQCVLFTHKSVPVIFEPPCIYELLTTVLIVLGVFTEFRKVTNRFIRMEQPGSH